LSFVLRCDIGRISLEVTVSDITDYAIKPICWIDCVEAYADGRLGCAPQPAQRDFADECEGQQHE
jgi:hypothetical protein